MTTVPRSGYQLLLQYFRDFRVLRETPREYWGIQFINFLDSTAYFSFLTIVTIFLSEEAHFSDTNAAYVVTVLTSLTTFLLLFTGFITDSWGIRRSLLKALISRMVFTAACVGLVLTPDFEGRRWLLSASLVLLAPSMAMIQTIFQSAIKRYTNERSRSAGFNLWYLFMNIGAATAGVMVDVLRLHFGLSTTWIVASGVVTSFLCLLVHMSLIRREGQFGEDGRFHDEQVSKKPSGGTKRQRPIDILRAMIAEAAFWRFLVLVTLLLGVRAVFAYAYLIMPKYWLRILGENAAIGSLNAINPFLIVIGLIVFIPFANRYHVFKMLVFGAVISSLSLFALVLPWQWMGFVINPFRSVLPAAWLADPFVTSYYALSILSMVLLSIGEVIWSPKLQEYTAAIAPEGQEGSYFGLSMIPWFLAKTLVSLMSGHMLNRWVPEGIDSKLREGSLDFFDTPEAMWLWLGLFAISGPILALIFKSWLTRAARLSAP